MISRLVCGLSFLMVSGSALSAALEDNGDGTVTNPGTGATWQQSDDDIKRNWKDAHSYCDSLALGEYTDWKLPTPTELASLVIYRTTSPTIDTTLFPSTKASGYWSASSMAGNSWRAWYVDFDFGPVDFSNKTSNHYVRCVRYQS